MIRISFFLLGLLVGCDSLNEWLEPNAASQVHVSSGITAEQTNEIVEHVQQAYLAWESQQYEQAYAQFENVYRVELSSSWKALREKDPATVLRLEFEFGKIFQALEGKSDLTKSSQYKNLPTMLNKALGAITTEAVSSEIVIVEPASNGSED